MVDQKVGNNRFLKEFNQKNILNLIRINKTISRAELSILTGLTPTAIGVIISNLLEMGYIIETGTGKSKGGRKPILLQIKPRALFSIGVDIDVNYLGFVLMDITGDIIYEKYITDCNTNLFDFILSLLEENIKIIIDKHDIPQDKILGIGISVPGIVDNETGHVIIAPNLSWENVNIKLPLEALIKMPVMVENDSMASAIAENWLGECQKNSNFVCVNIKSGIGSGIFIHGKPYKGASGSAGEVGHIVVDEDGIKCGCGKYGCLETIASTRRIVEKAKKMVRQGVTSELNNIADVNDITIDSIITAARNGDETAKDILLEAARFLGIALSSIVNTINPEKIILTKEFVKYSDLVLPEIQEIVRERSLKRASSAVQINASKLGEKSSLLGAAVIPIKSFYGQS